MTLKEVLENSKCVGRNVKLADINWFRVGGVADYLYKAQNEADLIALLEVLQMVFH